MKSIVRMVLGIVLGIAIGSAVNMALIMASGKVIPPPAGADVTTMAGLKASLHLFEPKHFLFPFLAHALGTLAGAFVAALVAGGGRQGPSWVVGAFFLAGGVANIVLLPGPLWFNAVDVLLAYLPMAWLGFRLAARAQGAGAGAPR